MAGDEMTRVGAGSRLPCEVMLGDEMTCGDRRVTILSQQAAKAEKDAVTAARATGELEGPDQLVVQEGERVKEKDKEDVLV
jgi:hypothetical protein